MNLFASLALSVAVAVAVTDMVVNGLPAPGKADAAKIQKNMAKNKAKKTQEVLQFGNQQNRQADTRNYARAEKRQVRLDDHEHDPDPVPEVNNALDRGSYPQSARHEKISELFLNPDNYGLQSLDADDRYKRNAYHFGSPVKRSGSRVYRPYVDSGRAKRDLDIDPEDWLALMTLVEAERKQKAHEQSRGSRQHYGRLNEYETEPYIENELQEEDDEDDVPEGWLEGPVVPAPLYVSPKDFYINNGYTRKQRAQHGSKNDYFQGLNHYQEEPQYYRLSDYYRHYNF
ncbi:prohormone-2-like [Sipha flava]|uniref:Prohormone-2 n=1 Tax=Sipha flava TaxID=143950 RepID=A0A2S2QP67_9HEMI|nr:prohormone-2-like [Sipha flava]